MARPCTATSEVQPARAAAFCKLTGNCSRVTSASGLLGVSVSGEEIVSKGFSILEIGPIIQYIIYLACFLWQAIVCYSLTFNSTKKPPRIDPHCFVALCGQPFVQVLISQKSCKIVI